MFPWGHLAVGYLVYAAYARLRTDGPPGGLPVLAALLGAQVPDLVDKPLAWTLAVLPTGRSLGHSLLVAAAVLPALWVLAARREARPLAGAFAVGYLSHLFADALYPLVRLDFSYAGFLGWPLVPPVVTEEEYGVLTYFLGLEPTPELAFELLLVALASAVWHADGRPGLATVRSWSAHLLDASAE